MIETNQQMREFGLPASLDRLSELVASLKTHELYPAHHERVERLAGLLKLLEANIRGSQDALTPSFAAEQAVQQIGTCSHQLRKFIETQNTEHLTQAFSDLENVIRVFPSAYRIRDPKHTEEFVEHISSALTTFTIRIKNETEALSSNISSVQHDLNKVGKVSFDLEMHINRIQDEAKNALTAINDEFQKRQVERSNVFSDQIQKSNERVNSMLEDLNESAQEALNKRENEFQGKSQEFQKTFDVLVAEGQRLRDQIRHLAGLAGTEALVGKFSSVGKSQKIEARIYRFVAYAGFAAVAVYMAWLASKLPSSLTPAELVQSMLAKSQLALLLLIPSTFIAIELRRLNKSQAQLEELELLIAAFGPFVDDLPDADKIKLKQTMAPVFFTARNEKIDSEPTLTEDHIKLIKQLSNTPK